MAAGSNQPQRVTIVLAGLPAAGKTTFATYLARCHEVDRLDVGECLQQWVPDVADRPSIGPTFVERFGIDHIAVALLSVVEARPGDVALDAVRLPATCASLRRADLGKVCVVFIDAPNSSRQARLFTRYAGTNTTRSIRLQSRYDREAATVRSLANVVVGNAGTVEELWLQARDLVTTLRGSTMPAEFPTRGRDREDTK